MPRRTCLDLAWTKVIKGRSSMFYCRGGCSLHWTVVVQIKFCKRICLDLTWTKVIMGGSSMFYCRGDCSLHWTFGQIKYCKRICLALTWTKVIMGGSSIFECRGGLLCSRLLLSQIRMTYIPWDVCVVVKVEQFSPEDILSPAGWHA